MRRREGKGITDEAEEERKKEGKRGRRERED
jgi:hypothetical protein